MFRTTILLTFAVAAAPAQNGSIAGMVKDAGTGAPLADVTVWVGAAGKRVDATTGEDGRYRLSDLPPAVYRVLAINRGRPGPMGSKMVNLRAGQDLSSVDFSMPANGVISGKVVDQNDEPMAGVTVHLLAREYAMGAAAYFRKDQARTDDQGEYTLRRVEPGHPYVIQAERRNPLPAVSEAPADPKLRRPAYVPTYYPGATAPEGGEVIVLRTGERREGMNIRMLRAPSFCIEGTLKAAAGAGPISFTVAGEEISSGVSRIGGLAGMPPGGVSGPDGRFRVCDLRPGAYRIMAYVWPRGDPPSPLVFGAAHASIADADATGLEIFAGPGIPIAGSIVWDGEPPDPPLEATAIVSLSPLQRLSFKGEGSTSGKFAIPGDFSFNSVALDDYEVRAHVQSPGVYVKDIRYGGSSVLRKPVRIGSQLANELRVVLARDGGAIHVTAADKDGAPVPDASIAIMPADARSEAALADALVTGQTDQEGNWSSGVLAPGKYLVLATQGSVDVAAHTIRKLWNARARAKDVELRPNGSARVTLEPGPLD
jgi:hypothetical protein